MINEVEIIQIEQKTNGKSVYVLPVVMHFVENSNVENAALIIDDEMKSYACPMNADWKDPKAFLVNAVSAGNDLTKVIFYNAYIEKKNIFIGKQQLEWTDYESIFSECDFYIQKSDAEIIDLAC